VVDDGTIVVGPQQHERAVETEELLRPEPGVAVGDAGAVADHAAEALVGGDCGGGAHRIL
jgi:hypothetical protein